MPSIVVGPPNPFLKDFPTLPVKAGTTLHRVHHQAFRATSFNPSKNALYRFSPIWASSNKVVPVLYAGESQECAFMETIFRNVAEGGTTQFIRESKLKDRAYSTVTPTRDLRLGRLDGIGLSFFRVQQQQVTATSSEFYPITARWAESFQRADPTLDGIAWVSHRATPNYSYLLFNSRVAENELTPGPLPLSVLSDATTWRALKTVADTLHVRIPDFTGVPTVSSASALAPRRKKRAAKAARKPK